jgi:hypothetical protein
MVTHRLDDKIAIQRADGPMLSKEQPDNSVKAQERASNQYQDLEWSSKLIEANLSSPPVRLDLTDTTLATGG